MKKSIEDEVYINEIIRVNYKCNWSCKFCNVSKTNNYGDTDVSYQEVVLQILALLKKYDVEQRKKVILSFSGGEPTLNKNLCHFIRLAKKIGIGTVEIQTNGTTLFQKHEFIHTLIDAGLDEIFLAQHSGDHDINKELGVRYKIENFVSWVEYMRDNKLNKKIRINLNIVVTKINLFHICDFIVFLCEVGLIDFILIKRPGLRKISFGFCQPNGYAMLNKEEVLLDFDDAQKQEVEKIVSLCKKRRIFPDFHFTSPPLCVLDYPEYNLEHSRLKRLQKDQEGGNINVSNLESYKWLWREKQKFDGCNSCKNNDYCLGFYKNWVSFVGEDYAQTKVQDYLSNNM